MGYQNSFTTRTKITFLFASIVFLLTVLLNVIVFEGANKEWQNKKDGYMREDMTHFASLDTAKKMYRDLQITNSSGEVIHQQGVFVEAKTHNPSKFWIFRDPLISWADGKAYYWGITTGSDGLTYTTVDDVTDIMETRNNLIQKSLIISGIGLGIVIILGYFFAGYALRPIQKMQSAARDFSLGEKGKLPHVGIYGNIKDEVVLLAQSLEELFARVHKEAARLEQFSDDIAHEIKNRLFEMQSSLELALKTKQYESHIKQTQTIIHNLSNLVDALLFFSRNEISTPESTNLSQLIQPLLADEYHRITLSGESTVTWEIFPRLFQTALHNIISNAQKFTDKDGHISIAIASDRITITDDGIGIDSEHMAHIFERFYRVPNSETSNKKTGHGLGLAITKKIIEDLHGMSIQVESIPGKGTSFVIQKTDKT